MSDSVIRPIPDRIEHLGSDLDGILRATGDGQPPSVATPGEHYATPEALASGLGSKADLVHSHAGLATAIPDGHLWVGQGDGVPAAGPDLEIIRASLDLSRVLYANTFTGPDPLAGWHSYGRRSWEAYPDGVGPRSDGNTAEAVIEVGHRWPAMSASVTGHISSGTQPSLIPLWLSENRYIFCYADDGGVAIREAGVSGPRASQGFSDGITRDQGWSRLHCRVSVSGEDVWVSTWCDIDPGAVAAVQVDSDYKDSTWCGLRAGGSVSRIANLVIRKGEPT